MSFPRFGPAFETNLCFLFPRLRAGRNGRRRGEGKREKDENTLYKQRRVNPRWPPPRPRQRRPQQQREMQQIGRETKRGWSMNVFDVPVQFQLGAGPHLFQFPTPTPTPTGACTPPCQSFILPDAPATCPPCPQAIALRGKSRYMSTVPSVHTVPCTPAAPFHGGPGGSGGHLISASSSYDHYRM